MAGDCAKYRDDLSGFVDETLSEKRWCDLARHLAGCPLCREETAEIRELRSTLSLSSLGQVTAPSTLASRLGAIAGDEGRQPLYFRGAEPGPSCPLPSKRRRRKRMAAQGSAAVLVLAMSVAVLAIVLAPEPRLLSNAVDDTQQQFAQQTTAIHVQEAVGAVLLAHDRGAKLAVVSQAASFAVDDKTALPISAAAAEQLLTSAAGADVALSGTQEVFITNDEGGFLHSEVAVTRVTGEGASLVVFDRDGNKFLSSFAPDFTPDFASDEDSSLASWDFYAYPALTSVAGRDASLIEARSQGQVAARWWFDAATGIALRSERFDTNGYPTILVGYQSLRVGQTQILEQHDAQVSLSNATSSGTRGWCIGLPDCPSSLAGLPLVAYSSTTSRGERSMNLVYSNGVQTLTATWAEGVLDDGSPTTAAAASGLPSVVVWQSGQGVIAVATNGSRLTLRRAQEELPGESPYDDGLSTRLASGLARIAGLW